MKISMTVLKLQSGQYFQTNNFKRALFCKNKILRELRFLFSAHSLMMLHIRSKFQEIILDGIKVTEWIQVTKWTIFSLEKFKRGISPKILQVEL